MVLQSAPVTCQGCEVGRREVPGQVRGKGVKKYYSKFDLAKFFMPFRHNEP